MAKISQASSKYIINATIEIDGVVDKPDVVGAIFGQVEGLLGSDLELRELQKSGRIGRIEVDVDSKDAKTKGTITIPSSLDKAETAIIGGAIEIIERIGPCAAHIKVIEIRDERIQKRQLVINRAKELLKSLNDNVLPDSQDISSQVSSGIRVMELGEYGPGLACGPTIAEEKEIIFVEGRADVINMLKHGFKNVISINGTSIPKEIRELSKAKSVTIFVDGDRGGDVIIEGLLETCNIEYITKAPDGKEVEELQQKEIHQALRSKKTVEEYLAYKKGGRSSYKKKDSSTQKRNTRTKQSSTEHKKVTVLDETQKETYKKLYKELKKKKDAYVLDKKDAILGKLSIEDLLETLPHLDNAHVVIAKTVIDEELARALDKARVKRFIGDGVEASVRAEYVEAKNL